MAEVENSVHLHSFADGTRFIGLQNDCPSCGRDYRRIPLAWWRDCGMGEILGEAAARGATLAVDLRHAANRLAYHNEFPAVFCAECHGEIETSITAGGYFRDDCACSRYGEAAHGYHDGRAV